MGSSRQPTSLESLRAIEDRLERSLPRRVSRRGGGDYGAVHVAAAHAGFPFVPWTGLPSLWHHGWAPPWFNDHPEAQLLAQSDKDTVWQWVARTDQADALRRLGYRKVREIGLPICYAPRPEVPRTPASVLLMPAHSAWTTEHSWDEDALARYAVSLRSDFELIVACLYFADFGKGTWLSALRSAGIPVIAGAQSADSNSLRRMAALFSRFEVVVMNALGSALVYAQLFGARAAIDGPIVHYEVSDCVKDAWYTEDKRAYVEWSCAESREEAIRARLPQYCVPARSAINDLDWARWQAGWQHRLTPAQMRELFEWTPAGFARKLRSLPARFSLSRIHSTPESQ